MDQIKKQRILIVEDDIPLLNGLTEAFENAGYEVIQAIDGVSGLSTAIKEHPDLIILDVIMPNMNGMDMLKKLRSNPWGKKAIVILLSNDDDPAHIRETLKDNATDYLIKSDWKISDIIEKIKDTLRTMKTSSSG